MYSLLLITHFIGLAMGVGTGFAMFTLGLAARTLPPADRAAFMIRASVLGRVGAIGLVLLIVSGFLLMYQRGGPMAVLALGGGMLHVKLTLVAVLVVLVGFMHSQIARAKRAGGGPSMPRLAMLGNLTLLVGILTTVFAVLAFH
jgi:uncharacterized membrane protein